MATKKVKKTSTTKHSKAHVKASELVEKTKVYTSQEAITLVKKTGRTKFDGTIEAHFTLNKKDQKVSLTLPNPVRTESKRILVFGTASKADNVIVATENTITEIREGKLVPGRDFDVVLATPETMPNLAQVAKTLGPKGMMPNPKTGTITDKPDSVIKNMSAGQISIKSQPEQSVLHVGFAKVSWTEDKITQNFDALIESLGRDQIKKITINATMGPGISLKI